MTRKSFLPGVFSVAFIPAITIVVVVVLGQIVSSTTSRASLPDSPLPTLTTQSPVPTPEVTPSPSQAAQIASAYIAAQENIPADVLQVVADHPTEYPNLGRRFQVVTLLDTRPQGQVYKLLVDLQSGQIGEDVSALLAAEDQARQSRYGKLQPALYQRLQTLRDDEPLPVAIWIAAGPGQSLAEQQAAAFATVAAKYPEAQEAMQRSGKPMDVSDPVLARQIEAEYVALINAEMNTRVQPLVDELKRRGFVVTVFEGMPSVTATLPKSVIIELSQRDDVSAIYLIEEGSHPELASATPEALASAKDH
jgi:hypothetical protein